MTIASASHVTAGYGRRVVLRDCDVAVDAGELVAVVGPNGAGKSTIVRVLAGLIRPVSGEVRIGGVAIDGLGRAQIARQVAVVPQTFETLFPFTVREIVALGRTARLDRLGRASAVDAAATTRAIDALGLGSLAEHRIDEISGGERQRVVLAMAVAQETPLMLLDEPTVHLDLANQLGTMTLVRELARARGIAVLAVVHDLNLAAFADRVVVIAGGAIVRMGPPSDVLRHELVRSVFGPGWRVEPDGARPHVFPE